MNKKQLSEWVASQIKALPDNAVLTVELDRGISRDRMAECTKDNGYKSFRLNDTATIQILVNGGCRVED